jgi:hypothetical protein
MSLNWQTSKNLDPLYLSVKPIFKGKASEAIMHPVLHRLIFLTMRLGCDLTRNQADVVQRIAILREYAPDLVTLQYDENADRDLAFQHGNGILKFTEYYPRATKNAYGWSVPIDASWVAQYWGLSTNADRIPFKKWVNMEAKRNADDNQKRIYA